METLTASRRTLLGAGASLLAASQAQARPRGGAPDPHVMRILERYDSFGDKASGGPGDTASGEWLEGELEALGYACTRQGFDAPAFEGEARLTCGTATATLIPQAIVRPTPPSGITAPLSIDGRGGIALVVLPYARWSTIKGEPERRVRAAIAAGAEAIVLVTTGPTGEAVALNAPLEPPLFDRPVAILAPKDVGPFLEAAQSGASATLAIEGRAFRRPAFNLTARLDRGAKKTLVVSTPRSGWFGCAGERGSGLAAWLLLARWAAANRLPVNVALVATSGHEYEYAGGEFYIAEMAPKPAATALWVHVGANAAARDWHERGPILSPLPSADPQRFLLASASLLEAARAAFAGLPGLEAVYAADPKAAAGELASILQAGYGLVIGLFGAHRYHHTRADDLRCVSADLIPPVAEGFAKVITAAVAQA
jgi:hypothetical protein